LREFVGGRYVCPRAGEKFGREAAIDMNLLRELRIESYIMLANVLMITLQVYQPAS